MRAIETRYQGYRFRSRLEARWAVFFTATGIPWRYESEGYDLGNGVRYLPDFYLPKHEIFVEIKPDRHDALEVRELLCRAYLKCMALSEVTRKSAIMLAGDVWPYEYNLYVIDSENLRGNPGVAQLKRCRRCDGLCFETENGWGDLGKHSCKDHDRWPIEFSAEHWSMLDPPVSSSENRLDDPTEADWDLDDESHDPTAPASPAAFQAFWRNVRVSRVAKPVP